MRTALSCLSEPAVRYPSNKATTPVRDNGKQHMHTGVSSDHRHRGYVSLVDIHQFAGAFVSPFGQGAKDTKIRVSPVPAVVSLSSSCDIAMI